jgi:hypothetical protein
MQYILLCTGLTLTIISAKSYEGVYIRHKCKLISNGENQDE